MRSLLHLGPNVIIDIDYYGVQNFSHMGLSLRLGPVITSCAFFMPTHLRNPIRVSLIMMNFSFSVEAIPKTVSLYREKKGKN